MVIDGPLGLAQVVVGVAPVGVGIIVGKTAMPLLRAQTVLADLVGRSPLHDPIDHPIRIPVEGDGHEAVVPDLLSQGAVHRY